MSMWGPQVNFGHRHAPLAVRLSYCRGLSVPVWLNEWQSMILFTSTGSNNEFRLYGKGPQVYGSMSTCVSLRNMQVINNSLWHFSLYCQTLLGHRKWHSYTFTIINIWHIILSLLITQFLPDNQLLQSCSVLKSLNCIVWWDQKF